MYISKGNCRQHLLPVFAFDTAFDSIFTVQVEGNADSSFASLQPWKIFSFSEETEKKKNTRIQQVKPFFPVILLENQTAPVWLTEQRRSWSQVWSTFLLTHCPLSCCSLRHRRWRLETELLAEHYQGTMDSSAVPTWHSGRQTSYGHVELRFSDSKVKDKNTNDDCNGSETIWITACERADFQCATVKSC